MTTKRLYIILLLFLKALLLAGCGMWTETPVFTEKRAVKLEGIERDYLMRIPLKIRVDGGTEEFTKESKWFDSGGTEEGFIRIISKGNTYYVYDLQCNPECLVSDSAREETKAVLAIEILDSTLPKILQINWPEKNTEAAMYAFLIKIKQGWGVCFDYNQKYVNKVREIAKSEKMEIEIEDGQTIISENVKPEEMKIFLEAVWSSIPVNDWACASLNPKADP